MVRANGYEVFFLELILVCVGKESHFLSMCNVISYSHCAVSLVTSNDYNLLLMFTGSYDYWIKHDCCDAWIEHCIKFGDRRTHTMEKVEMNIYGRRSKQEDNVFRGYNYSIICCYISSHWSFVLLGFCKLEWSFWWRRIIKCCFFCAMSLVMKIVDWHNDEMEKVGRNN